MFKTIFIFVIFAFSHAVLSQTAPPVDGVYWDPGQGGRGYAVETQNDNVFVAIYNYDQNSSPSFYTVQGKWDPASRRIRNAELFEVTSGPWIGGPFSPVGQVVSKGPVTFEFPTFTTARFVFNGQTSKLQRFIFGYGSTADSLMGGVWHSTYGSILIFGDFINITGKCTISSCSTLSEPFVGQLLGQPSRIIMGTRLSDGKIMMLIDSSTSYYSLYVFDLRVNQWAGWQATYLKTSTNPPTSGPLMLANRIYGPAFAPKRLAVSSDELELVDMMKAKAAAISASSLQETAPSDVSVEEVQSLLPALTSALEQMH